MATIAGPAIPDSYTLVIGVNSAGQTGMLGDSGGACIYNGQQIGIFRELWQLPGPSTCDWTATTTDGARNWIMNSVVNYRYKDFNKDGKIDLVWHNGGTGQTQVWFMDGVTMASQATLDPRYPVLDSSGWSFAGTGDFNYDGKVDVVWHNGGTGVTKVWYMDGVTMASQAALDPRYPTPDSSGWRFAGTGDFNYDGKVDVVWHNGGTGQTQVWYMDGVTMTNQAPLDPRYPTPDSSGWRFAGTGDFNYDGKVDVVWHNGGTGATQVWYLDGVTMTSQATLDPRYPTPDSSGWRFAGTGDYDYDGKIDVLWHNGTTGATQVWYLDGVTMASQAAIDPRYSVPDSSGWRVAGN
jgi:hypothetical protein